MNESLDTKKIAHELKIDAVGLGIPIGAAESFIKQALKDTEKQLKTKKIITKNDLERIIAKELKKYNADLAYVYKNRDKII